MFVDREVQKNSAFGSSLYWSLKVIGSDAVRSIAYGYLLPTCNIGLAGTVSEKNCGDNGRETQSVRTAPVERVAVRLP